MTRLNVRLRSSYYAEVGRLQSLSPTWGKRVGKTYGIGFASKYPEGGAEEGE